MPAPRATMDDLRRAVSVLNTITGHKQKSYTRHANGDFKANIGTYDLSGAYGGWELEQIVSAGGGVRTPLNTGHVSKRECLEAIRHFIAGIEEKNRANH